MIGCEKSPAATLRAARSSRFTRADERARHEVAGEHGDHERDPAGDQHLAADQLDVVLHVGERLGEHRDVACRRRCRRSGSRSAAIAWRPLAVVTIAEAWRPSCSAWRVTSWTSRLVAPPSGVESVNRYRPPSARPTSRSPRCRCARRTCAPAFSIGLVPGCPRSPSSAALLAGRDLARPRTAPAAGTGTARASGVCCARDRAHAGPAVCAVRLASSRGVTDR